jgi:hypothetical protein
MTITFSVVRTTTQLAVGSVAELITIRRRLQQIGIPVMRHRVLREVLLIPARFTDRALSTVRRDGHVLQEILPFAISEVG